jgi:hypothetical protein
MPLYSAKGYDSPRNNSPLLAFANNTYHNVALHLHLSTTFSTRDLATAYTSFRPLFIETGTSVNGRDGIGDE